MRESLSASRGMRRFSDVDISRIRAEYQRGE